MQSQLWFVEDALRRANIDYKRVMLRGSLKIGVPLMDGQTFVVDKHPVYPSIYWTCFVLRKSTALECMFPGMPCLSTDYATFWSFRRSQRSIFISVLLQRKQK